MIWWKKNYNFGFNHGNCVDVCKEIMCWYEFLKCYAKIYGFSLLDAWSCFRLYFHVVFDHKHLKLEPLIFGNKKNDTFMGCGMKIAKGMNFWAISRTRGPCSAHAKLAEAHLLSVVFFAHAIRIVAHARQVSRTRIMISPARKSTLFYIYNFDFSLLLILAGNMS
jgi:hypothetical protein